MELHFLKFASRIKSLPVINVIAPPGGMIRDREILQGYYDAQVLAQKGAAEIAGLIQEGWTEKETARLLDTWLADNGVSSFFHHSYAWFGERTRFDGIRLRNYWEFKPSNRVIKPGEVFILDVAPIVNGVICDIGHTSSLGPNPLLDKAMDFLHSLRADIPSLFSGASSGASVWHAIAKRITDAEYDTIHKLYPFSVLGHRVHKTKEFAPGVGLLHFGWQSYWTLLSRGLFGQLLNHHFEGDLLGLWAIEPHIGAAGFGAKFEEILVINRTKVYWLSDLPAQVERGESEA